MISLPRTPAPRRHFTPDLFDRACGQNPRRRGEHLAIFDADVRAIECAEASQPLLKRPQVVRRQRAGRQPLPDAPVDRRMMIARFSVIVFETVNRRQHLGRFRIVR